MAGSDDVSFTLMYITLTFLLYFLTLFEMKLVVIQCEEEEAEYYSSVNFLPTTSEPAGGVKIPILCANDTFVYMFSIII